MVIYSAITTIIIEITHENDDVIGLCAFGIVGCFLILISKIICKIRNYFKYHYNKRSIFMDKDGNKVICHTKDANDVNWNENYKFVKRYAIKSEWNKLPMISEDILEKCKINCSHCKFDRECDCSYPYIKIKCKHDEFGTVIEFDKFEKAR